MIFRFVETQLFRWDAITTRSRLRDVFNDFGVGGSGFACTILVISLLQRSASLIWQPLGVERVANPWPRSREPTTPNLSELKRQHTLQYIINDPHYCVTNIILTPTAPTYLRTPLSHRTLSRAEQSPHSRTGKTLKSNFDHSSGAHNSLTHCSS